MTTPTTGYGVEPYGTSPYGGTTTVTPPNPPPGDPGAPATDEPPPPAEPPVTETTTETVLAPALSEDVELRFAAPQPDPAPPTSARGSREAAAQLRQAHDDSYPGDGSEPADGTIDAYRPGAGPQEWTG